MIHGNVNDRLLVRVGAVGQPVLAVRQRGLAGVKGGRLEEGRVRCQAHRV